MISIFTTKDNLESICLDENKQPWLDMIIKLKQVFVNEDDIFPDDVDPEEDPFYTLDGMQVDINSSKKEYINDIPHNPVLVLNQPLGIFLLDIPVEKANQIQTSYGVMCQSTDDLDYTPLSQPHFPTELLAGETGKSWKSMIAQYKELPSNSVLIIDAHLFAEDKYDEANKCYDEKKRDGLNNIFDIINCLLPTSFKDTYHIGVLITDTDKAKAARRTRSNLTNDRIASAINKLKKSFNRNYPINIEVIFFDPDDDGHKLIHNRCIISNYFMVTAEYKLAALRNGRSLCGQSIAAFPLFENIDKSPGSDKKEKRMRNEIKLLADFIHRQPNSHTALLYQNGKTNDDFSQITHRFFNRFK
jgi:hypothetical protein